LTLPKDIRSTLDDLTRREGISPNDLILEAIKWYLLLRQIRLLRERMVPKAQAQGIFTDQDVFDRVS
jgi:hypothetical protein